MMGAQPSARAVAGMLPHGEITVSSLLTNIGEIVYQVSMGGEPLGGRVTFVSPQVTSLLGYEPEEFLRDPGLWFKLLHPDDALSIRQESSQQASTRHLSYVSDQPHRWTRQYRLKHKLTGEYHWMEDKTVAQRDCEGRLISVFGAARDITDRKQAEAALRESEGRFRTLVDSMDDIVFTLDSRGRHTGVFGRWLEKEHFAPDMFLGKAAREVLGPAAAPIHEASNERALAGEHVVYEWSAEQPDGTRHFQTSLSPIRDTAGTIVGVVGVGRETTEHKRVEEDLAHSRRQLRDLARRLQATREQEQVRIARDLHDELGQALTVLKIDLSWLGARLAHDGPLHEKAQHMIALVDDTIDMMRSIVAELRPPMLDDLGLAAAAEWLVQRFSAQTRIPCRLEVNLTGAAVDIERAVTAYRILQETLTNAARHACASNVIVGIGVANGDLLLEVRDDGRGITEQATASGTSLGLLGMQERARVWGGEVSVSGVVGAGTTVTARIPLAAVGHP